MAGTDPVLGSEPPSVVVGEVDPLVGQELGGYRVTKLLAAGGMGLVYEALHETIGRRAAVKVLKPEVAADAEWTKRFLTEARALGSLKHRNLIEIINFGKTPDGREYLMMEFLEGEPLDAYIRRLGALPPAVALGIADQVLNGLAEAHKKGVVHRDLKPSNVYLLREHNGELLVKVLDFGLARQEPIALVDMAVSLPTRSDGASLLAGTPEYIAPEQAQGLKVDATADLYAFGVMLFEMLSGQLPFEAPSVTELLQKHLSERPPKLSSVLPGVSEEVEAFVDALLEKEPERRPASADAARVTVQRLLKRLAQDSTAVRPMPRDPSAAKYAPTSKIARVAQPTTDKAMAAAFPERGKRRWWLAALALLVLLIGVGWWWSMRPPALPPVPVVERPPVVEPKPPEPKLIAPVDPEDEVAPVPSPPPVAEVKPPEPAPAAVVKDPTPKVPLVKNTPLVIEKKACEVTEEWKRSVAADLQELGELSAKDEALYAVYEQEGRALSRALLKAQTVNDCAAISTSLESLTRKILKK